VQNTFISKYLNYVKLQIQQIYWQVLKTTVYGDLTRASAVICIQVWACTQR